MALLCVGAVGGLIFGLGRLAAADVASLDPESLRAGLRDRVFWLNALPLLVLCYTTFEVVYRASDARWLSTLPIRGRTRLLDILIRATFVHLPLIVPALAYGIAVLVQAGPAATAAGTYALMVPVASYVVAVPVSILVHVAAGRSLLKGGAEIRKMLAGGAVPNEDALLLYSPAGGLAASLLAAVFLDLLLYQGLVRSDAAGLAWGSVAGAAAIGTFAAVKAAQIADRHLFAIVARFAQAEMPLPYREDGVPERTPGEGIARWLPAATRPYFMRDLRQLRRRYRLDRVLLVAFAIALVRLNWGAGADGAVARNVAALAITTGLLLVTAFRTHGELASPWLHVTLPSNRRAERLGRLVAASIHPLEAAAVAAIAAGVSGGVVAGAITLAAGVGVVAAFALATHALAERAFPDKVAWAALGWRVGLTAALGGALWQSQG